MKRNDKNSKFWNVLRSFHHTMNTAEVHTSRRQNLLDRYIANSYLDLDNHHEDMPRKGSARYNGMLYWSAKYTACPTLNHHWISDSAALSLTAWKSRNDGPSRCPIVDWRDLSLVIIVATYGSDANPYGP